MVSTFTEVSPLGPSGEVAGFQVAPWSRDTTMFMALPGYDAYMVSSPAMASDGSPPPALGPALTTLVASAA